MPGLQIVLDTNVLVAALHSPRGTSYRVLGLIGQGRFDRACERFGLRLITPAELLREIGELA